MTESTVVIPAGEFHVAVKGTLQSRAFPYTAAGQNYNEPDAPPREEAFKKARTLWRKVKRLNPDREVRLMDFPVTEFFVSEPSS